MKFVLALLMGVAYCTPLWDRELTSEMIKGVDMQGMFTEWATAFDKTYQSEEEAAFRFGVWSGKIDEITESNNNEELTYKLGLNQFSDLTWDEFLVAIHGETGNCLGGDHFFNLMDLVETDEEATAAPDSVDWQAKGAVTPVKNQASCGSCWAFATTGALECDAAAKNGQLISLSEQQLVDCSRSYGNQGCNGGWWFNAFQYIQAKGGLCTESAYPYTAKDGTCRDSSCGTKMDAISGYTKTPTRSDSALATAVAIGCNAVGVDVTSAFSNYKSGVLTAACGTAVNHGVTAVGYGTTPAGQDYWKVKNSWGASWGDKGYIYICRNCNKNSGAGECGINLYPGYATPK
jgi:C1A family cysteine protease